jgi:PPOX class probable F420-dependent enzyme
MAAIEGRVKEILDAPNFATIATLRKDGSIHSAVVWAATEDGHVVLNTAEGRAWPKHLRRDPRVTINVHDESNPYEYVEVRGHVEREATGEEADRSIDELAKKYLGQDKYPYRAPGEERIKFVIAPDNVRHQTQ